MIMLVKLSQEARALRASARDENDRLQMELSLRAKAMDESQRDAFREPAHVRPAPPIPSPLTPPHMASHGT